MRFALTIIVMALSMITSRSQDFSLRIIMAGEIDSLMNSKSIESMMSTIAKKYKSDGFRASYPNAKNPELKRYFTFKGWGDGYKAIEEMRGFQKFLQVEWEEIVYPLICQNPLPPVNDKWIPVNYALDLIDANCAWGITKGSPNVLIGIADTDVETNHEDLATQIATIQGQPSDHFHGTVVAGIASAETNNGLGISSIGYMSRLSIHRIPLTPSGGVYLSDTRDAIWNLYLSKVPIINVSIEDTGLDPIAAEEITQQGTVLVLGAGNSPLATCHKLIANINGVILVSAVNENNVHGPTNFARNEWIDICAPGVNVPATYKNNSYGVFSGTSCTAPIVSGTIALMLSVNPCLTPAAIEAMIKQSADPIADAHLYPGMLGAGRVNAYQAVMEAGTRRIAYTTLTGTRTLRAGYIFRLASMSIGASSSITFRSRDGVSIEGDFQVPLGSSLTVTIDPDAVNDCP